MRRRQAGDSQGTRCGKSDSDGIFILASPEIAAGKQRHQGRHQRSNIQRSFCVLLIIAITLALSKQLLSSPSMAATPVDGINVRHNTVSRERATPASTISADSNKNISGGSAARPRPRIPRRLIFTYKYNLLAPSEKDPPFDPNSPLTANVLHTITKYRKYWDGKDATLRSDSVPEKEEVVVSFLSDDDCRGVITKADPRLLDIFNNEKRGEFKADICRVAELYLYGGYYFDIDIGVIKPLDFDALDIMPTNPYPIRQLDAMKRNGFIKAGLDDIVTFSTVYNKQGRFFQAFTAVMPKHPVLKRSLSYMVGYYEGTLEQILPQFVLDSSKGGIPSRQNMQGMGVGPYTLAVSYRSTEDRDWQEYVESVMNEREYTTNATNVSTEVPAKRRYARFLYEISLEDNELARTGFNRYFQDIPLQDALYEKKVQWCNFICFGKGQAYFYSRVPGSKGCPLNIK